MLGVGISLKNHTKEILIREYDHVERKAGEYMVKITENNSESNRRRGAGCLRWSKTQSKVRRRENYTVDREQLETFVCDTRRMNFLNFILLSQPTQTSLTFYTPTQKISVFHDTLGTNTGTTHSLSHDSQLQATEVIPLKMCSTLCLANIMPFFSCSECEADATETKLSLYIYTSILQIYYIVCVKPSIYN